jgi:hypothetical protein
MPLNVGLLGIQTLVCVQPYQAIKITQCLGVASYNITLCRSSSSKIANTVSQKHLFSLTF